MRRRLGLVLIFGLLGASASSAIDGDPVHAGESRRPLPLEGSLLFVLRGKVTVRSDEIRLTTKQVEWFTDRPDRAAGRARVRELVDNWDDYGFVDVPPNAALGRAGSEAVVELTDPRIERGAIVFGFVEIRGDVERFDRKQATMFIDGASGIEQTLELLEPGQTISVILSSGTSVVGQFVSYENKTVTIVTDDSLTRIDVKDIEAVGVVTS